MHVNVLLAALDKFISLSYPMLLAKLKGGMMESKPLIMEKSSKKAVIKKEKKKKTVTEVKLNLEIQKVMLFQVALIHAMDSA